MIDLDRFSFAQAEQTVLDDVIVGNCFAFLKKDALAKSDLAWMIQKTGDEQQAGSEPQVVSLLGPGKINLFGLNIKPKRLASLKLRSIVSDKSLYKADSDKINLFVLDPLSMERSLLIRVQANGSDFCKNQVMLDANGAGQLVLRDLPAGEYAIFLESESQASCRFVVAEYRLVPLVASLRSSEMDGQGSLNMV